VHICQIKKSKKVMGKEESTEKKTAEHEGQTADEKVKQESTAEEAETAEEISDTSEEENKEVEEEEITPLEKAQIEVKEAKDKYLRLYSEFENYRRRTAKEKIDFTKTATEKLIEDLLPILDDFERAQKSFPEVEGEESDPIREGFDIIYNKFKKTLEKQGVTEIENPTGKELDTNLHEAITQFPAPKEELKGKIVDQVEKGYLLGEKVVRFSKVVVGI
jgi:molecular chaperone GrpE